MSENKQFKLHIEWYNQEKTDGKATLKEMGQPLGVIESIEDARLIRDTLNELYDEKEQLKEQLMNANELNGIYVDFLVDKGFELSDVIEWSKRS